jgi:hypothetical protein
MEALLVQPKKNVSMVISAPEKAIVVDGIRQSLCLLAV